MSKNLRIMLLPDMQAAQQWPEEAVAIGKG